LAFLPYFDGLPDLPRCPVTLAANDCRLVPVDDMIICVDVVCYSALTVTTTGLFLPAVPVLSNIPLCGLWNYVLSLQKIFWHFKKNQKLSIGGCFRN